MDELLTVSDCAVILQVGEYQVREYINKGLLKAQKLGASGESKNALRWRIWQKDLEDFINRNSQQS